MKILSFSGAILLTQLCFGQNTIKVEKNIKIVDTLPYFDGNFSDGKGLFKRYKINERKVTKEVYEKYYALWNNINRCKPCWLKAYTFDKDSTVVLSYEGLFYIDKPIGLYRSYFSSGTIQMTGQYRAYVGRKENNENGNWVDLSYYGKKIGRWQYYNWRGETVRDVYFNGRGYTIHMK